MKAIEQYFLAVLYIMLYKVVLYFMFVDETVWMWIETFTFFTLSDVVS